MSGVCTIYDIHEGDSMKVVRNGVVIIEVMDSGAVKVYTGDVLIYAGDVIVRGNAHISTDGEFVGDVYIKGNLHVNGDSYFHGDVSQDPSSTEKLSNTSADPSSLPSFPDLAIEPTR